jgi:hypothetical protein
MDNQESWNFFHCQVVRTQNESWLVEIYPLLSLPMQAFTHSMTTLRDHGAGGGAVVLPGRRENTDGLVVAGQTVDTRLNQNETELGVLILAVALEMLADGNGLVHSQHFMSRIHTKNFNMRVQTCLLDQEVQVLRNLRAEA